ncbi:MAG: CNP1-like family protein [Burkholderiales bacterium]|nr:CNP1-like family protein [Burkholderiales bacterium]
MRRATALACALWAAAAHAQAPGPKSDWERAQEAREFREAPVTLPPFYREEDLIEFSVGPAVAFRFYIDRASLSVGEDGVVRYTLVARSPHGAENVSYEGIRCRTGTHRVYALGQRDRSWRPVERDWQPTDRVWTRVLRRDYFCPMQRTIFSAAEGLEALRRGGHPERENWGAGGAGAR